jgi:NAD+ kinase
MIGLLAHSEKPAALSVVGNLVQELDRHGIPFLLDQSTAALAGRVSDLDESALAAECELLVVMGGDGTILRVVQKLGDKLPPVFGINIGSLGFLTCLGAGEIKRAVESIRDRTYNLSPRALLKAELQSPSSPTRTLYALNDVVVSRGERSQLVQLHVSLGDIPLTDYNADGLIVATPTGSTAYSLSAGGPILMPDSGCFVVTPICPHVLTNRSVVLSDGAKIKIEVTRSRQIVFVSGDAQSWCPMSHGETLVLSKSERVLPLAMLPERPFTEVLRQKLKWTGSNV